MKGSAISLLFASVFASALQDAFMYAQRSALSNHFGADVHIIAASNHIVQAHSHYLVAQSFYFRNKLKDRKPGTVYSIAFNGFSLDCVKSLVSYMYTGELNHNAYSNIDLRNELISIAPVLGLPAIFEALKARKALSDDILSIQDHYDLGNLNGKCEKPECSPNEDVNKRISLYQGNIARVSTTAVVNAANTALKRGSGVDDAIHSVAGPQLQVYCNQLEFCKGSRHDKIKTGDAISMPAFQLPADFVIATAAPTSGNETQLQQCYENSYKLVKENGYTSISFPCLGTGVYGFLKDKAATIALRTTRKFLEENTSKYVVLVLWEEDQIDVYKQLLPSFFPAP